MIIAILALLTSVLYIFSFAPWDYSYLSWFCIVPYLFIIHRPLTLKRKLKWVALINLLIGLGGFYWVGYALKQYGNLPWSVAILGLVLFSLFNQPQFYFFAIIHHYTQFKIKRPIIKIIFYSLFFTACENIAPKLFQDTLGHSWLPLKTLVQATDLFGVYFITFLCASINFSIFEIAITLKEQRKFILKPISAVIWLIAVFGFLIIYGTLRTQQIENIYTHSSLKPLSIAVIQANIGDFDKVAAKTGNHFAAEEIVTTYLRLSDQASHSTTEPEFIIWPETAYPSLFGQPTNTGDHFREERIRLFTSSTQIPIGLGGYDFSFETKKDFNAFFLLQPSHSLQIYQKNILLLFGEYIPFTENSKIFKKFFPQVGNFGRGKGASTLSLFRQSGEEVLVAPIICYEALFPDYTLASARLGNQLIVNITNDSWFGELGEPYLHLSLTAFRSIETRIPQIRSTNTGISTLISPLGEYINPSSIKEEKVLYYNVPIVKDHPVSLYEKLGVSFGKVSLILSAIILILLLRKRSENN